MREVKKSLQIGKTGGAWVGSETQRPKSLLKVKKECFGCGNNFICSSAENFDYCQNCQLNGSRHIPKENRCPECGDGSGIIKFSNQPPRVCKICSLKPVSQVQSPTKHETK